jgi:hypothetical protein
VNLLADQPMTRCSTCVALVLYADLHDHKQAHEQGRREMEAMRSQVSELRDRLAAATKGDDQR